jgi:hypothetical protein
MKEREREWKRERCVRCRGKGKEKEWWMRRLGCERKGR